MKEKMFKMEQLLEEKNQQQQKPITKGRLLIPRRRAKPLVEVLWG